MFRKFIKVILILAILIPTLVVPSDDTEAQTLRDLKEELAAKEAEYKDNQNKQQSK